MEIKYVDTYTIRLEYHNLKFFDNFELSLKEYLRFRHAKARGIESGKDIPRRNKSMTKIKRSITKLLY